MSKIMKLERFIPDLKPSKLRKNAARFWKLYIRPPKERGIFLPPEDVPQIFTKIDAKTTKAQPKQGSYDINSHQAFVSCMEGKTLQVFSVNEDKIKHKKNIPFEDQCVEVLADGEFVFVTTTNFERPPRILKNKLWILDIKTSEIISSVDTEGNWSKLIALRPQGGELLVSNWHSHDISVIGISNPRKPIVKQVLKWGEAPRGMAFLPEGDRLIVTGFYSGNLGIMEKNKQGEWTNVFTSEPFDKPNYPGNMRHVLISPDNQYAIVSNLGRNLVHFWNIQNKS